MLSLLVLGQGVALLRDERKARPDRQLSAWLTRAQTAQAESLGAGAADGIDETREDGLDGAVADSTASAPGAKTLESVSIESVSNIPPGVAATGRVAINRASARDLEALPGIGPSLAKRIVEEREKAGPFRSPRDLLRVKGIGPKKQAAIQDRIDWSL